MLRILQEIGGPRLKLQGSNGLASLVPGEGRTFLDPMATDTLTWFRGPRDWDSTLDLSDFTIISHFRDPRDLACNQFWWALQHPNTRDTPERAAEKRQNVEQKGIDGYALGRNNSESYLKLMALSDARIGDAVIWTSYNQLCCAFDYLMDNLCRTFGRAPTEVAEALSKERPENLGGNADGRRLAVPGRAPT